MTATPNIDLSKWLTDSEACARLGWSPRTLDRKAASGELHPMTRQVPGKRGQRVWDPEEIQGRLPSPPVRVMPSAPAPAMVPAISPPVAEMAQRMYQAGAMGPEATMAMLARLIDVEMQLRQLPKPWATLKEAAEELGLSRKLLRRLVMNGSLEAVRDIAIKVRRADLDELNVETELVEPEPRKKKNSRSPASGSKKGKRAPGAKR